MALDSDPVKRPQAGGVHVGHHADHGRAVGHAELTAEGRARDARVERVNVAAVISDGHRPGAHAAIALGDRAARGDDHVIAEQGEPVGRAQERTAQVDRPGHLGDPQRRPVARGGEAAGQDGLQQMRVYHVGLEGPDQV